MAEKASSRPAILPPPPSLPPSLSFASIERPPTSSLCRRSPVQQKHSSRPFAFVRSLARSLLLLFLSLSLSMMYIFVSFLALLLLISKSLAAKNPTPRHATPREQQRRQMFWIIIARRLPSFSSSSALHSTPQQQKREGGARRWI